MIARALLLIVVALLAGCHACQSAWCRLEGGTVIEQYQPIPIVGGIRPYYSCAVNARRSWRFK